MKVFLSDLSKVGRRAKYFAFTPYIIFTEDESGALLYMGWGNYALVFILKDGNVNEA